MVTKDFSIDKRKQRFSVNFAGRPQYVPMEAKRGNCMSCSQCCQCVARSHKMRESRIENGAIPTRFCRHFVDWLSQPNIGRRKL